MVLVFAKNEKIYSRAAVVSSKKIGNAVVRNRVKRKVRASLDPIWHRIIPSWDLILYTRPGITLATFEEINQAIDHLLKQAEILGEEKLC